MTRPSLLCQQRVRTLGVLLTGSKQKENLNVPPAPRPLERYKVSIANDGRILVDKTKSFKWEKGEWENPESYLTV